MGIIPDEQWEQLRGHPDWQDRLRDAIESLTEWQWIQLLSRSTASLLAAASTIRPLEQPGEWEMLRTQLTYSGIWDATREQVSRSWFKEHLFRLIVENDNVSGAVEQIATEALHLMRLKSAAVAEGRTVAPEPLITISASDLEDLLDAAVADHIMANATEDDWIPWDQVEAEAEALANAEAQA